MIPVFIASAEKFAEVEPIVEFAIRENTSEAVDIRIVRPEWYGMKPTGCTGFTNVRYSVPELCRDLGYEYGIYLDVDMFVLGDIAELYEYRQPGKWVCLKDGSNEVSVVSAELQFPGKDKLHRYHKSQLSRDQIPGIPMSWNVQDQCKPGMKLLHFTDLSAQPWFFPHPCAEAVAIYEDYRARYYEECPNGLDSLRPLV